MVVWIKSRSEGFPLVGYFVLGRDGVGVGQDSRILLVSSLTNVSVHSPKTYINDNCCFLTLRISSMSFMGTWILVLK